MIRTSPECGKRPPSGQKCILTVYVIIELVYETFRTSSPAGNPPAYRLGARSGQVRFGQPAPADSAPKPVYWID